MEYEERADKLEKEADLMQQQLAAELERVKKSFKHELVRYEPPGQALIPARELRAVRVPARVQRDRARPDT